MHNNSNKQINPLPCHATGRTEISASAVAVPFSCSIFIFYPSSPSLPPAGEEILSGDSIVCMNVNMTMTMTRHRATCNVTTTQDIRTGEKGGGGGIRRPL